MGDYGGVDEVEIDEEHGFFYVHRTAGYWNRYKIDKEPGFYDWCMDYGEFEGEHKDSFPVKFLESDEENDEDGDEDEEE